MGTLLITLIVLFYVRNIHATLMALASNDSLTDLPNRRTFFSRFKRLISLKQRNKQKLSLVFFDIDDFKQVNDAQGHDVGDKVLIEIASILKTTIRHTDVVARWGGEEFIILLVDSTLEDAQKTAEQLRKNIENSATLIEHAKQKVTVSLGVTEVRESEDTDSLFKRVDNALYQAKKDGKNCVSIID